MSLDVFSAWDNAMRDAVKVRLPPSLLLKPERRAARLEMSRDTYIASILERALEDGHPIIVEAGFDDQSSAGSQSARPRSFGSLPTYISRALSAKCE
jgi:hypothetical protein